MIGDEILSGRTKDKNIGYIAEYLTAIGVDLREVRVVPDVEDEIVAALNALRHRYTYVFTTGGIGPTHDDITADCVAKAFGVPIDYDPRAVALLQAAFQGSGSERGAHAHDAHPAGRRSGHQQGLARARLLDRQCDRDGRACPPSCRRCSTRSAPRLKTGKQMLSESVRADTREGDIGTELGEIAKAHPDVSFGSYPFFDDKLGPNTNVVVRARDAQKLAAAKSAVEEMLRDVKARLKAAG